MEYFGPDYKLPIHPNPEKENLNDRASLDTILSTILQNLKYAQGTVPIPPSKEPLAQILPVNCFNSVPTIHVNMKIWLMKMVVTIPMMISKKIMILLTEHVYTHPEQVYFLYVFA